jgi:hypothetical protein
MSDEQSSTDRPQPTEAIPMSDTTALPSDPTAPSPDSSFAPGPAASVPPPPPSAGGPEQPWPVPAPAPEAAQPYPVPQQPAPHAYQQAYQQPYQQPTGAAYPYGQAPPPAAGPYGYGAPPAYATGTSTNSSALTLTILSGISVMFCGGLTLIPSLVFGILGLSKQGSDPAGSAKMTRWGWIAFAVGWVLSILFVALLFVVMGALPGPGPGGS